jgi:hypothetical protein
MASQVHGELSCLAVFDRKLALEAGFRRRF